MKLILAILLAASVRAAEITVYGDPVLVPVGTSATVSFPPFPTTLGKQHGGPTAQSLSCDFAFSLTWDSTVASSATVFGNVLVGAGLTYSTQVGVGSSDAGFQSFTDQHCNGTVAVSTSVSSVVVAPAFSYTSQVLGGDPTNITVIPQSFTVIPSATYQYTPKK